MSSPVIIGYFNGEIASEEHIARLRAAAPLLTHVNYAFGLIDEHNRAMLGSPEADIAYAYAGDEGASDLGGNFRQLQRIKEQYPHLQTLISLGGWIGSGRFSDAAATPDTRREFVASTIELFLTRWPDVFDGIDIDWEYPVCCGLPENSYRAEDRRNCTLLFREFRQQLDELGGQTGRRYLLTAALPAGRDLPLRTFEIAEIARILDWINVMTYDISGSTESGITNFNAALHPSPADPREPDEWRYQNVSGTVETFLGEGVPREKLVVGMPFYGRGFTGVPDMNHGLYQSFDDQMFVRYHQIVRDLLPVSQRFWHATADVPWLYNATTGTMLSYDDPESLRLKGEYIRRERLGGAMFWELSGDTDDLALLTAIHEGLGLG
ncbi:MAG TPA: glycoside hydrolase family 18 protein [Thermomicrobiales bacterium]|nr:glycoside hydrolase family 18 protein [Thermomicrobiales bacterium]